ncbi:SDR family NAD(P)-dependent oxidoreductase [Pontibacter sp. JAM-7]|uniref:SDR family NAD(P)-dependent oxidoreductase n=1 Tax=Pontibacter sp. JAM-7 TaxID=3366581 RepID=UPI003AF596BF
MNLPWQRVWITGAGRGIGRALARLLAEQGAQVYVSSRTLPELQALAEECQGLAGRIVPVAMDITDLEQVRECWRQWQTNQGPPELVVLNAGTHQPVSAQQFSADICQNLWRVNLQGTVNCLEPALQQMLADQRGQIAVMASVAGYRGLPTASVYGASKAALINMCEALRLDLTGSGVKLQVINPGFVRTPLTDQNRFPMPCLMEPEVAAQRILKGLLSNRFEITFPRRFTYCLKLLRLLPYRLYLGLIARTVVPEKPAQRHNNESTG